MANGAALTPHLSLGWQHAFGDVSSSANLAFVGGGSAFSVSGVPIARDAALVGAGVRIRLLEDGLGLALLQRPVRLRHRRQRLQGCHQHQVLSGARPRVLQPECDTAGRIPSGPLSFQGAWTRSGMPPMISQWPFADLSSAAPRSWRRCSRLRRGARFRTGRYRGSAPSARRSGTLCGGDPCWSRLRLRR